MSDTYFVGDGVSVEELPNGCVVSDTETGATVVIPTIKDARMVIMSLLRMIDAFSKEERGE